ncbi:Thioredoxin [Paramyrothecium foliicola]|nr:Thioredoxin [Paramyrothecium foliicola]
MSAAAVDTLPPAQFDSAAPAAAPAAAPEQAEAPVVVDITSKAQFDELIEATPYVALQAHATWCGPCKAISPIFKKQAEKLVQHQPVYTFAKFDIDDVPELAADLKISSIPAFFFFDAEKTAEHLKTKSSEDAPYAPAADLKGANVPGLNKLFATFADKAKNAPIPEKPAAAAPANADPDAITPVFSTNEDF